MGYQQERQNEEYRVKENEWKYQIVNKDNISKELQKENRAYKENRKKANVRTKVKERWQFEK